MNLNKYNTDNNIVFSCKYHIIFCPKYRKHILIKDVKYRLNELIVEKQCKYGYKVINLEIMSDHVHLLIEINPKLSVNTVIKKIKGYTSRILKKEFNCIKYKSLWTNSKFISSVGSVSLEVVKKYIENQGK